MSKHKNKKGGFFNFLSTTEPINNNSIYLTSDIDALNNIKLKLNTDYNAYLNNKINENYNIFIEDIQDAKKITNNINTKYTNLHNNINIYTAKVNDDINNKNLIVSKNVIKVLKGGGSGRISYPQFDPVSRKSLNGMVVYKNQVVSLNDATREYNEYIREVKRIADLAAQKAAKQLESDNNILNLKKSQINTDLTNLTLTNKPELISNMNTVINTIETKSNDLNNNVNSINTDFVSFDNAISSFITNIKSNIGFINNINRNHGNIAINNGGSNNRMEQLKYEDIMNNFMGGMKKIKIEKKDGSKVILTKDKKGTKIIKKEKK